MFGNLDSKQIEHLLSVQIIGRIGCPADGLTYIVPVSYRYDGNYVYCLGQPGQKIDMMRKNPNICFQIDDTTNLANWKSVVAWGTFEEIIQPELRIAALQKLHERKLPMIKSDTMHLTDQWPFSPENLSAIKGIVFRILLVQKTGKFEKTGEDIFFAS